jgi:hypothetical protein
VYLQHDNLCHAIRSSVLILFNLCYTMSSQPAKEWTIIHHFGGTAFKGRAEFLRLMLKDKKIDYGLSGDNLRGPKGMMDCFRGSAEAVLAGDGDVSIPNPVFFPPALWHRPPGGEEVIINQVGACVMYLGEILGYASKSPKESALANAITMNAIDYIAEGRSSKGENYWNE